MKKLAEFITKQKYYYPACRDTVDSKWNRLCFYESEL